MTIIGNPEAPPTATTGKPAANPTAAIGRLPTYHTAPRPEKTASFLFPFSRLPEIPHLRQSPDVHGATMWRTICDKISYNRIFCNKTRKISPLMVSAHRFRQTNTYNCTRCPQSARPSACRVFGTLEHRNIHPHRLKFPRLIRNLGKIVGLVVDQNDSFAPRRHKALFLQIAQMRSNPMENRPPEPIRR